MSSPNILPAKSPVLDLSARLAYFKQKKIFMATENIEYPDDFRYQMDHFVQNRISITGRHSISGTTVL
jgi:hypothetical protein